MNKILVEVSVGELIDKMTILEIKNVKIEDSDMIKYIDAEYKVLEEQLNKNIKWDDEIGLLKKNLKEVNSKLWDIENEKRECEKNSDFGKKFIKLSRDVHFLNDKRAKIKIDINNYTGSKIREVKQYSNY